MLKYDLSAIQPTLLSPFAFWFLWYHAYFCVFVVFVVHCLPCIKSASLRGVGFCPGFLCSSFICNLYNYAFVAKENKG